MLEGQGAIITGASRGIGRAVAGRLARAGAAVVLLARGEDDLAAAAASIRSEGGIAHTVCADLGSREGVDRGVAEALACVPSPAILVNNAGLAIGGPLHGTDDAAIDAMVTLNLRSVLWAVARALTALRSCGRARIVNIASTAGLRGYRLTAVYAATKHALVAATRTLAEELRPDNITVNALCPGFVDTPALRATARGLAGRMKRPETDVLRSFAAQNASGRLLDPSEVAEALLTFLGPAGGALTGQTLALE